MLENTVVGFPEIRSRGPLDQYLSVPVTIKAGRVLPAGQALGQLTADDKFVARVSGASDGSQTCKWILGEPVDATNRDVVSFAYRRGNFWLDKLTGVDSTVITQLGGVVAGNELII